MRRRSCFELNVLVLAAKFPNHAQITLASKMATIVPTSYRKTAKKYPDVSVKIPLFCREKTAAECPYVQLVRHSQSISTTCSILLKIAAFVVGEDNKYSDILLKIRLQIHTLVARKRPNVSLQWCSRTRSPTSNPSSPKRESRLLQTPSQLCHFPFKTPMLLPRCTIPTFHPADRAGKREPRCG